MPDFERIAGHRAWRDERSRRRYQAVVIHEYPDDRRRAWVEGRVSLIGGSYKRWFPIGHDLDYDEWHVIRHTKRGALRAARRKIRKERGAFAPEETG